MEVNLSKKRFGDKIRTCHLNADRFPSLYSGRNILQSPHEYRFSNFGVLTRFADGKVGVTIHCMHKKQNGMWFGLWIDEDTEEMTKEEWAKQHVQGKKFESVEDVTE